MHVPKCSQYFIFGLANRCALHQKSKLTEYTLLRLEILEGVKGSVSLCPPPPPTSNFHNFPKFPLHKDLHHNFHLHYMYTFYPKIATFWLLNFFISLPMIFLSISCYTHTMNLQLGTSFGITDSVHQRLLIHISKQSSCSYILLMWS